MTNGAKPADQGTPPDKLSIVVYSGRFDRVHYALAMAAAAAAIDTPTTLFFTMGACRALLRPLPDGTAGWAQLPLSEGGSKALDHDRRLGERGVARFEELIEACRALEVTFMICEMGLRAMALEVGDLRDDISYREGGLVTFLRDASDKGALVFI
ncbi:MAG: DsrE/DsrF/DrsH-like family protein [Proteobacteria bacterium]|nr:DsrE/DsrF/DrsH-like family protein [Pseudomonadota bacterium]